VQEGHTSTESKVLDGEEDNCGATGVAMTVVD
jgi:hypothetical protein